MKITLRVMVSVVALLFLLEGARELYCRLYSETVAAEQVRELCKEQGYDLAKLSGPVIDGTNPPCYTWTYQDSSLHLDLTVAYNRFYEGKVAVWNYSRKD